MASLSDVFASDDRDNVGSPWQNLAHFGAELSIQRLLQQEPSHKAIKP
jgi:hypothetical protein